MGRGGKGMGVTVVEFMSEPTQCIEFLAAKGRPGRGLGFGNQGLLSHGLVPPLIFLRSDP
jgi:hypothetical protein